MSDNTNEATTEQMFEAAKEITKVGMMTALKLASAVGVPQGAIVLTTTTAGLATLINTGLTDEGVEALVEAARRTAAETKAAVLAERGLEGMLPAGNA